MLMCLQLFVSQERSSIWGKSNMILPPDYAAFVNGIAVSLVAQKQKYIENIKHDPALP